MTPHSTSSKGEVQWDPAHSTDVFGNDTLTAGQRECHAGEALGGPSPRLQKTRGAALERQLLLEASPDTPKNPKSPRRFHAGRWLVASLALTLLTVAACVALFQDGRQWQGKAAAVSTELQQSENNASLLQEAIHQNNAESERLLAESKVENRSLAVLAEKSMEELKRCLGDFRLLQKEKDKLESRYRQALSHRQSSLGTALLEWLPRLLKKESVARKTQ